jgi:SAM-dependent methyltransferase
MSYQGAMKAGEEKLAGMLARCSVSLELGCGPYRAFPTYLGVDSLDYPGVDISSDVFEFLEGLPGGCVENVHSSHFLEHVSDLTRLIDELARVCKPGARVVSVVPHFSNPYFYSDPTHTRFFGLYTMSYFARDALFRRTVPTYGKSPAFDLEDLRLSFRSPFRLRYALRLPVQWAVNATRWGQEFYEEFLTPFFYCYELTYTLVRNDQSR